MILRNKINKFWTFSTTITREYLYSISRYITQTVKRASITTRTRSHPPSVYILCEISQVEREMSSYFSTPSFIPLVFSHRSETRKCAASIAQGVQA